MKTLLALFALLLLVGCTSPKRDNTAWTNISCSGASSNWQDCWSKAQALCPNGYDWTNKREMRESLGRTVDVACK